MRIFARAVALGLLLIALSAFLALRGHGPSAFPGAQFKDRAAAEQAGAFAGTAAWLPRQIPPGATFLRESHNPATHQTWGYFRLPPGGRLGGSAAAIQPGELMLLGAPKNVDWWPAFLRGRASSAELEKQGFGFVMYEQGEPSPLVFAVRGDEVWFWRLARQ